MATLASQLSTSKYFVDLFDNWISSFCKNKILSDCSLVFNQSIVNMAKNTSSSAFRKIDIDQYNEDNFKDDEAEQAVPTGPDEGEVSALLNQYVEALQLVLSNAPLGSSNQQVKDNALALTLKVLLAIKSAQIEEAVGNLSRDDIDVLMKYIYRGFEYPSEGSSGHLLLWHEKAYNIGGSGSIVRVLSDRMKV